MIFRGSALALLLAASPACAQGAGVQPVEVLPLDPPHIVAPTAEEPSACGACTALDRATMADPAPPSDMPPPRQAAAIDHGKPIDLPVPGTNGVTVYHKAGAGLWVGDLAPGGVFVRPNKHKLSVDMKF